MYANAIASQNFSSDGGPSGKLPSQLPTSSSLPITPSGLAMNSTPTTAKVTASERMVSTTARSAAAGGIAGSYLGGAPR